MQQDLIDIVTQMVNGYLQPCGRQSGKTTARKLLAERILADDDSPTEEHTIPCKLRINSGHVTDHKYCECWCHAKV